MFDVAFSELLIIAVVALVVIGPEKLPKVARTMGLLAGRMQRYVASVKADVERELQAHDLQKLGNEVRQGVAGIKSEVEQEARHLGSVVDAPASEVRQAVEDAEKTGAMPGSP